MAASSQSSRFPSFTMANGRDTRPAPSPINPWSQPSNSIWNQPPMPIGDSFKRNASGSRLDRSEETLTSGPSGSSALATTSEAELTGWRWGNTDGQTGTRNLSGNSSPSRTRDITPNIHDISSSQSHFQGSRSVIGHEPTFGRSQTTGQLDATSQYHKFDTYGGFDSRTEEKENTEPFPGAYETNDVVPGYRGEHRGSTAGVLDMVPATSREPSIPRSSHSEMEQHRNGFGGNMASYSSYTQQLSNPSHGLRPGLQGSASFPSQSMNQRAFERNTQLDDDTLPESFRRSLTLDENQQFQTSRVGAYTQKPFAFNPGSQAWDDTGATRSGSLSYAADSFSENFAGSLPQSKRSSIVERGSTPGALYRNAAKPYGAPSVDSWSRPSSRDPRMHADLDRRAPAQPFAVPHQPFFPPNYYPQFQSAGMYPDQQFGYNYWMQNNGRPPIHPSGMIPGLPGMHSRQARDQDPAKGVRSALLDEFRSNGKSNKRFELKDIYDHVAEFSGDQHGSRFIQGKLETANSDEKDVVFREIEPNAVPLMKDVFGNYVIQKFFEHGSQVQKKILASLMKGKVVDLSLQTYACRVVQKALEHILVDQQAELVKELESEVIRVAKDQNGNHVIQKIIELVDRRHINFVMDSFRGQVSQLSTHNYGCRVIQRILEHGSPEDKDAVMAEIHQSAHILIIDQYGNYVAQHVIHHGESVHRSKTISLVTENVITFSKHKFASNVVEKAIEYGTPDERRLILNQIMALGTGDDPSQLQLIMKDQYGNYVIQKLLRVLDGSDQQKFADLMKPHVHSMKKTNPTRQTGTIERLLLDVTASVSSTSGSVSRTTPASPLLHVETNSVAPTPSLTMEPNTPQSSSPPSTNASVPEEPLADVLVKSITASTNAADPEVRVEDSH